MEGDLEHPRRLEGGGRVHQHRARALRSLAGPRGALRYFHDQLGREDMAGAADGSEGAQPDAHLPAVPEPDGAVRWPERRHVRRRGRPGPAAGAEAAPRPRREQVAAIGAAVALPNKERSWQSALSMSTSSAFPATSSPGASP